MRLTHVSIIHFPFDTRIFLKQCRTLAAAGYEVHLVVPGPSAAELDGVQLHAVSEDIERPRARRQWWRLARAARLAFALRPSVYHIHEAHLIPLGLVLKLTGARVVYDVHEDYPAHARTKLVGHPVRGRLKALMWRALESLARAAFDGFVCASRALADRFPSARTVVVGNFPIQHQFVTNGSTRPYRERANRLIYTGNIAEVRGFREMARALELLPEQLDCRLRMVGGFRRAELASTARELPVWDRMELLAWRPFPAVIPELLGARVGLILLHPLPNHQDAIRSNKLFEYMAAGLPVVASDLPRWRELVLGAGCGLVVDIHDPAATAGAIEYLLRHPDEAEAMGERGRAAVRERFNWDGEAARLMSFYRDLAGERPPLPVTA